MTDREKMYRRQLGGAEAALRRERQRVEQLEELIRDMNHALIHNNCYRWCEADRCDMPDNGCQFRRRMRELGIEVGE